MTPRLATLLSPLALVLTASVPPSILAGHPMSWSGRSESTSWTSAGVRIDLVQPPCPARDELCTRYRLNTQVDLRISAPGVQPYRMTTRNDASHYRISVVRLDRRDTRPGIVIENDTGGSAGVVMVEILVPTGDTFRRVTLQLQERSGRRYDALAGDLDAPLRDRSGDGRIDFILRDPRFIGAFDCNACSPRPPIVLNLKDGQTINVSSDPAFAAIFRADMALHAPRCFSRAPLRNGACAAYVASATRIGRFTPAWRAMLAHYERDGRADFPDRLKRILYDGGYIKGPTAEPPLTRRSGG